MKNIFSLLSALFLFSSLSAQPQIDDAITKTNGDVISGKVTEVNDDNIKFIHSGETLVYTINKSEINKIHFASGRVEAFNPPISSNVHTQLGNEEQKSASISSKNKIAILPVEYLLDKRDAGDGMGYKAQTEAFNFLSHHCGIMQVQDPSMTNALLIKAGMTKETIRGFTPIEICNALDVEYIVQTTITQDKIGETSSNSQLNYYDSKGKTNYGSNSTHNNGKTTYNNSGYSYGSGFGSASERYQTIVTMSSVSNTGKSVYSDSYKSFWAFDNAYKLALQSILKRTPFYTK